MKNLSLTAKQKHEFLLLHNKTRDAHVRDRIKAIIHASNGWSAPQIAAALLIHESSVRRHINEYLETGNLQPKNGGSEGYLSTSETLELVQHLTENMYHHTRDITAYVLATFGKHFTVPGMNKLLHRHKFSYKRPKGVPHRFDELKQAEFIKHYEELKRNNPNEPIFFIDAVHPTQATKLTSGWIPTGKDKEVNTTGSRTRLSFLGALNLNQLDSVLVNRYEKVNSETIVEFLSELRKRHHNVGPLHIVLDGAGYHRAHKVVEKADELGITLHYLPPYSPNLNPIERLWKIMNEKVRNNRYFSSAKEFRERLDHFFDDTLPTLSSMLSSWINDNFQVLKHAS